MTRQPRRAPMLNGPYGKEPDRKNPGSDVFTERAPRSAKNRKKFCGGNPARPHIPQIVFRPRVVGDHRFICHASTWANGDWLCWHQEACSRCGKVLRRVLPRELCPGAPPAGA